MRRGVLGRVCHFWGVSIVSSERRGIGVARSEARCAGDSSFFFCVSICRRVPRISVTRSLEKNSTGRMKLVLDWTFSWIRWFACTKLAASRENSKGLRG